MLASRASQRQAHLRPAPAGPAARLYRPVRAARHCCTHASAFMQQQGQQAVPAAGAQAAAAGANSTAPRRVSAGELFDGMCTMFGGLDESTNTGYAGQWRTWQVGAGPGSDDECSTAGGPAAAADPQLIDDSVNIRLWRTIDAGAHKVQQSNLYQTPKKMAGPCTRFLPYLTANTMAGRPDGYGLRVWSFAPDSFLVSPDGSAWRGAPETAQNSMRVLTVPRLATAIINGSLPSGFEDGHEPRFWVLEFIIKEADSEVRRWSSMNWYELGRLVVNRSVNEDVIQLPQELDGHFIDPQAVAFAPRRDGLLPADIDAWAAQHVAPSGTSTVFSYDDELQLTVQMRPCAWSAPVLAAQQAGGVVSQPYPDWSYCRMPRDLPAVLASGADSVAFEAGSVLRDGSLRRWVVEYHARGDRLLKSASYEHYPPAAGGSGGGSETHQ